MPHILVAGPWEGATLRLAPETARHLRTVLRLVDGDECSYTDGEGLEGLGVLHGSAVERGDERRRPDPPEVTLAVAPPASRDRARWLVEKACEVGVSRIRWLRTAHGEGRIPRHDKAVAWAQMAMEQSRRAHLAVVDSDWTQIADLTGVVLAFDRDGGEVADLVPPVTVIVGPEGGWQDDELPDSAIRITLGDGVLRTETAAIVGLHAVISGLRR